MVNRDAANFKEIGLNLKAIREGGIGFKVPGRNAAGIRVIDFFWSKCKGVLADFWLKQGGGKGSVNN